MINAEGWFDWAERLPGNSWQVNIGRNSLRGLVCHSAEGYESTLLDPASQYGYKGNHSWHASNLKNGRFVQHHSLFSQTWHANAMNPFTAGMENEGVAGEPLEEAQIRNIVRAAQDIAALKNFAKYARLTGVDDPSAFLLVEHNQAPLFGGDSTACPSHRIPWDEILRRLMPSILHVSEVVLDGEQILVRFAGAGNIEIHDGDEWVLVSPGAALTSETLEILAPQGV